MSEGRYGGHALAMLKTIKSLRFRYRLITLLGFMTIVALAAGAYGNHLRRLQRQEEAFREIASKGGIVHVYSYGTSVFFENTPPLMCMSGIRRVIGRDGASGAFTDKDCHLLNHVLRLHDVHFPGSNVSEKEVATFHRGHSSCRISTKPFADWQ